MSDNPFDEPGDTDRTRIIRPSPGGRSPAPPPRPLPDAAPRAAPAAGPAAVSALPSVGASPLLAAAAPLLQLLGRLRSVAAAPDPADLRARAVQELRHFETAAQATGLPPRTLRTAHYALCASLDDVVMNTPWGSTGAWAQGSLVATFHGNVSAGEGFFQALDELSRDPSGQLPLLELMYYCLSLGFEGRYRVLPRGASELEKRREQLYGILLRLRPAAETALSPRWRGVDAPYRPLRAALPFWVMAAGAAALLAVVFLLLSGVLERGSDAALAAAAMAPPTSMPEISRAAAVRAPPPPPASPGPSAATQIRRFLQAEIEQGLVTVTETAVTTRVQVRNTGVFPSGSASVRAGFLPLLNRIGEALNTEPGRVRVIGHTDNQPIHTVQFPSNFQLSNARAEAARTVIGHAMQDPARLSAEGRADLEPVASNYTPEGREANRRIEIVLQRQG